MRRFLSQALVIARRDFTAIVLTPTFLIFLLAPLFMLGVATVGSLGAVGAVKGSRERIVIVAQPGDLPRLRAAETRLRDLVGEPAPPPVTFATAGTPPRALLRGDVAAVLSGRPDAPKVLHRAGGRHAADYLAQVAAGATGRAAAIETIPLDPAQAHGQDRNATAFGAVFTMFLLTLLLSSQAISMLAEEKGNKVIEILAAAIPLEAVFLGKLVGMLGVALLFTAFWGAIAAAGAYWGMAGVDLRALAPAMGLPAFALLFLGYFILAFLLLGAVFLGVGAQAATMREIQMLSLPVTIFQVAMFALASAGAGDPHALAGIASAIFPFSSPFAMAARAAIGAPAWQYAAAFAWQLLWLGITVTIAARLFRRGVLKSGGARRG